MTPFTVNCSLTWKLSKPTDAIVWNIYPSIFHPIVKVFREGISFYALKKGSNVEGKNVCSEFATPVVTNLLYEYKELWI